MNQNVKGDYNAMEIANIFSIEGTEFPAGRRTRVMLGPNGALRGKHFSQGYVVIFPDGGIPEHTHPTVESYTILQGQGILTVNGETRTVVAGDYVFIPADAPHALLNDADYDLHMMFVYAPDIIVDHWAQEMEGEL